MSTAPTFTRIGPGTYRVENDGRADTVYVAIVGEDVWLHWNGQVFRQPFAGAAPARSRHAAADAHQTLTAPMPATVLKVMVAPGASVRKGDPLIVLEAMKMELPIRSAADATVSAVLCREGELVQPGAVLVELA